MKLQIVTNIDIVPAHGLSYVYSHTLNGELIYIGCGTRSRAHKMYKRARNKYWWAKIKHAMSHDGYTLEIRLEKLFKSRVQADEYEKELIKTRKPVCNLIGK